MAVYQQPVDITAIESNRGRITGNREVMLTGADHRKSIYEFVDVAAGDVATEAVTLTSRLRRGFPLPFVRVACRSADFVDMC